MAALGIWALALTVFVQGGFFARAYIPATVLLLTGVLLQQWKKRKIRKETGIIWFMLTAVYILSSLYHGLTIKEWDKVVYIFSIGIMHSYFSCLNEKERQRNQQACVVIGLLECMIGLLAYVGIPMEGVLINMRFMGTFQYANATALFLGMLLIMQTGTESLRWGNTEGIRILFTVFLQLTLSFGGIICYFMGVLILGRRNRAFLFQCLYEFSVSGVFSGSLFLAKFYLADHPLITGSMVLLLLLFCFGCSGWNERVIKASAEKPGIQRVMTGVLVAEGILCICRFGLRAGGTGWERILQMKDGMAVIGRNWWLGIGSHQLLKVLKSRGVSYETTLIHNSYIQIGVEAGVFAAGMVFLLILLWWRKVKNLRDRDIYLWKISVMTMAMIHFAIDISFYFWAVMGIVMLCVTGVEERYKEEIQWKEK